MEIEEKVSILRMKLEKFRKDYPEYSRSKEIKKDETKTEQQRIFDFKKAEELMKNAKEQKAKLIKLS